MAKDTRNRILDVARKLFAQKGYEGCSVDLIAQNAKVNKASIYYHFRDKASLYEMVLEKNLSVFLQRVATAVSREISPEKKLAAFTSTYAENFTSNKSMAPLMLRELASDGTHLTDRIRAVIRDIILEVDAILKEGQEAGLFRQTKTFLPYFMIVGTMNIYTSTQAMRKKYQGGDDDFGFATTPEETAEEISALLLKGLQKNNKRPL